MDGRNNEREMRTWQGCEKKETRYDRRCDHEIEEGGVGVLHGRMIMGFCKSTRIASTLTT